MANGKHARLRALNKINTTLRKNYHKAFTKGQRAGIEDERHRILAMPLFRRIKYCIFDINKYNERLTGRL